MSVTEVTETNVEIEIPIKFGRFRYLKTIGRGSSSVVVLARDEKTQEDVAAKFVSRAMLVSDNKIQYFERELRILESLKHPNIVEHKETLYLPTCIVVIMEYCSEGDLFEYCANHMHQSMAQMRGFFYQTVRAIAYLHSKGYGHRDLKLENIFLNSELHVKLGDLGLTKETRGVGNLTSTICGTLIYSAPEVIAGETYDPMSADIWSLGVMLYALVQGTMPWHNQDLHALEEEIMKADVEIPPHMPIAIAEIISACLVREPEKRATAKEILEMQWMQMEKPEYERMFGQGRQSKSLPPIRDGHTGAASPTTGRKVIMKIGSVKQVMHQPIRAVRSEQRVKGMAMSQSRFVFKTLAAESVRG